VSEKEDYKSFALEGNIMGLVSDWKSAKKNYDKACAEKDKARAKIEKKIRDLEKSVAALQKKNKADAALARVDIKSYDAFSLSKTRGMPAEVQQAFAEIVGLQNELHNTNLLPRKTTGVEPALGKWDSWLSVGVKMVKANVTDRAKWDKWRDLSGPVGKDWAKAKAKFEDMMKTSSRYEEARDFVKGFENIEKDINKSGAAIFAWVKANTAETP